MLLDLNETFTKAFNKNTTGSNVQRSPVVFDSELFLCNKTDCLAKKKKLLYTSFVPACIQNIDYPIIFKIKCTLTSQFNFHLNKIWFPSRLAL